MFKIKADPTFEAKVAFPVAGGESVEVKLTFRHRTKTSLKEWIGGTKERSDLESFMDMVVGWELDEEFSKANAELLLENHIGVALATYQTYTEELTRHREKN